MLARLYIHIPSNQEKKKLKKNLSNKRLLTVNFCILELSRRNAIVKKQIDFAKRASLGLGETKPAPNVAEEVRSGVKETGFGSPVPG